MVTPSIIKSEPLTHLKSGLLKAGSNVTTKTVKQLMLTILMKNCFATMTINSSELTCNRTAGKHIFNGWNSASEDKNRNTSVVKLS